ncbi:MAG: NosD domain-containing protein [Candidatus Hodarchaeota archaeon]
MNVKRKFLLLGLFSIACVLGFTLANRQSSKDVESLVGNEIGINEVNEYEYWENYALDVLQGTLDSNSTGYIEDDPALRTPEEQAILANVTQTYILSENLTYTSPEYGFDYWKNWVVDNLVNLYYPGVNMDNVDENNTRMVDDITIAFWAEMNKSITREEGQAMRDDALSHSPTISAVTVLQHYDSIFEIQWHVAEDEGAWWQNAKRTWFALFEIRDFDQFHYFRGKSDETTWAENGGPGAWRVDETVTKSVTDFEIMNFLNEFTACIYFVVSEFWTDYTYTYWTPGTTLVDDDTTLPTLTHRNDYSVFPYEFTFTLTENPEGDDLGIEYFYYLFRWHDDTWYPCPETRTESFNPGSTEVSGRITYPYDDARYGISFYYRDYDDDRPGDSIWINENFFVHDVYESTDSFEGTVEGDSPPGAWTTSGTVTVESQYYHSRALRLSGANTYAYRNLGGLSTSGTIEMYAFFEETNIDHYIEITDGTNTLVQVNFASDGVIKVLDDDGTTWVHGRYGVLPYTTNTWYHLHLEYATDASGYTDLDEDGLAQDTFNLWINTRLEFKGAAIPSSAVGDPSSVKFALGASGGMLVDAIEFSWDPGHLNIDTTTTIDSTNYISSEYHLKVIHDITMESGEQFTVSGPNMNLKVDGLISIQPGGSMTIENGATVDSKDGLVYYASVSEVSDHQKAGVLAGPKPDSDVIIIGDDAGEEAELLVSNGILHCDGLYMTNSNVYFNTNSEVTAKFVLYSINDIHIQDRGGTGGAGATTQIFKVHSGSVINCEYSLSFAQMAHQSIDFDSCVINVPMMWIQGNLKLVDDGNYQHYGRATFTSVTLNSMILVDNPSYVEFIDCKIMSLRITGGSGIPPHITISGETRIGLYSPMLKVVTGDSDSKIEISPYYGGGTHPNNLGSTPFDYVQMINLDDGTSTTRGDISAWNYLLYEINPNWDYGDTTLTGSDTNSYPDYYNYDRSYTGITFGHQSIVDIGSAKTNVIRDFADDDYRIFTAAYTEMIENSSLFWITSGEFQGGLYNVINCRFYSPSAEVFNIITDSFHDGWDGWNVNFLASVAPGPVAASLLSPPVFTGTIVNALFINCYFPSTFRLHFGYPMGAQGYEREHMQRDEYYTFIDCNFDPDSTNVRFLGKTRYETNVLTMTSQSMGAPTLSTFESRKYYYRNVVLDGTRSILGLGPFDCELFLPGNCYYQATSVKVFAQGADYATKPLNDPPTPIYLDFATTPYTLHNTFTIPALSETVSYVILYQVPGTSSPIEYVERHLDLYEVFAWVPVDGETGKPDSWTPAWTYDDANDGQYYMISAITGPPSSQERAVIGHVIDYSGNDISMQTTPSMFTSIHSGVFSFGFYPSTQETPSNPTFTITGYGSGGAIWQVSITMDDTAWGLAWNGNPTASLDYAEDAWYFLFIKFVCGSGGSYSIYLDDNLLQDNIALSGTEDVTYITLQTSGYGFDLYFDNLVIFDLPVTQSVVESLQGEVSLGETLDAGQIFVPFNSRQLDITLEYPGSNLDLVIIDPDGNQVDANSAGVEFNECTISEAYTISWPKPGIYTIRVYGDDVIGTVEPFTIETNLIVYEPRFKDENVILDGNAALASASNGGDGTLENPYILQDFYLKPSNDQPCLVIRNTDAHFILYHSVFHQEGPVFGNEDGIRLENVRNGVITGNSFTGKPRTAVFLDGNCINNVISDNLVQGFFWAGIETRGTGNSFIENYIQEPGLAGGIYLNGASSETLAGNSLQNCGVLINFHNTANAGTHAIDTSNTVNGNPIRYIVGQTGGVINPSTFSMTGQLILVDCDDVTIRNLDSTALMSWTLNGIGLLECDDITVENCNFDSYGVALYVGSSYDCTIQQNTFTNNEYAIVVSGAESRDHEVKIKDNDITASTWGIEIFASSDMIIENNRIENVEMVAITIRAGSSDIIVRNNDIDTIGTIGIHVYEGSSSCSILENEVTNTERGINVAKSHDNAIKNNFIMGNSIEGLHLRDATGNSVENNYISNNGVGVILSGTSASNVIFLNGFVSNDLQAIDGGYSTGNAWHGTYDGKTSGNYWSDYTALHPSATTAGWTWSEEYVISTNPPVMDVYPLVRLPLKSLSINNDAEFSLYFEGDGLAWGTAFMIKDLFLDDATISTALSLQDTQSYVIITNCAILNAASEGLLLESSTNVDVNNNLFSGNNIGIHVNDDNLLISNIIIGNNTFISNGIDVLDPSNGVTIVGNNFNGSDVGICLVCAVNITVIHNTFEGCGTGILLDDTVDSTIQGNIFNATSGYGVEITSQSTRNLVISNEFHSCNGGGVQAFDDVGGNNWTGNYWSDFRDRYPTAQNQDGEWMVSYELDGGAGAGDSSARVFYSENPVGELLAGMGTELDDLGSLIDDIEIPGRENACNVHLSQALGFLEEFIDEYDTCGTVSVKTIEKIEQKIAVIDTVAKENPIMLKCLVILGMLEDLREFN